MADQKLIQIFKIFKKNVQKGSLGQGMQILTPFMKIQYGGSNMAVKFSKKTHFIS